MCFNLILLVALTHENHGNVFQQYMRKMNISFSTNYPIDIKTISQLINFF